MATSSVHFDFWSQSWRTLRHKLAERRPPAGECVHLHGAWRRLKFRMPGVGLAGKRYCMTHCLERALAETLASTRSLTEAATLSHRIPLGLCLISRRQLTADQLQTALAAQRSAGRGPIGQWLQAFGFVTEQQVTAALARQWSCPVFRPSPFSLDTRRVPPIPISLLQTFLMIPVAYVEATATLHIAFGERIDYTVLYAIEQMLACHTEPCLAIPSFVHANLELLGRHRREDEVVFEHLPDRAEFARIIRSYCARLAATEVRVAFCGPHTWVRLSRHSHPPLDLVLRSH